MNGNLATAQFGGSGGTSVQKVHPLHVTEASAPLAIGAKTFGSVNSTSAWRLPAGRVLPHSSATVGSVFTPW